jgi:hypothetical protein
LAAAASAARLSAASFSALAAATFFSFFLLLYHLRLYFQLNLLGGLLHLLPGLDQLYQAS